MHHSRPKNLNLFTIRFPIPAIVSILHRISGVIVFFMIPILLWLLSYSLTESGFETLKRYLANFYLRGFIWLLLLPLLFHFVAGIRHLMADIHIGDSLPGGRLSAKLVFVVFAVVIILAGIWLW